MSHIRWGMVSAGRIAHTFAQDMAHVDNGELVAVAARSGASAKLFAQQYDIPKYYEGYDALFADPEIDAVYIATPHTMHKQNMLDAIEAGKGILCEKPFTVSSEECQEVIAAARSAGVYVMEAMWTWFLPAVRKAKEWVDAGRIGKIKHIKADFGYPIPYAADRREYDARLAGGCLLEMGIYPLALTWFFLRQPHRDLHVLSRFAKNGVEDDVIMTFDYEDTVASLGTSFRCKLANHAYIIGEDGYIVIPHFWRASSCSLFQLDERVDYFHDDRQGSGFEFETRAVGEDLLNKRLESETIPLSCSLRFQEMMEAVKAQFQEVAL